MSGANASRPPVALVTGGSRGIGLGIVRALLQDGHDVALGGTRPEDDVAPLVSELERFGRTVHYVRGDVGVPSDREAILDSIRERFARLDLLVNNAGVAPKQRVDLLDATEDSFEHVLRTNLQGPYFLTQAVARWMFEQKRVDAAYRGTIVNVSSISATVASINRGEYCLSKAALSMATKLWASRLAEIDVPVYEIRPGIIATDMTAGVKGKYDALIEGDLLLERRWGRPEDVGRAVAMLARGDLPYATGQVLVLDGGLTLPRL